MMQAHAYACRLALSPSDTTDRSLMPGTLQLQHHGLKITGGHAAGLACFGRQVVG